jgi:hypothetical protein
MSILSHTEFIEKRLNAPMKNIQWSYGAVDSTGVIYLKIWLNEIKNYDGTRYSKVMWPHVDKKKPGMDERIKHIELIKNGAKAFGLICIKDEDSEKLKVREYRSEYVIELINEFREEEGFLLVKLGKKRNL